MHQPIAAEGGSLQRTKITARGELRIFREDVSVDSLREMLLLVRNATTQLFERVTQKIIDSITPHPGQ
jgi:hypothetical protein